MSSWGSMGLECVVQHVAPSASSLQSGTWACIGWEQRWRWSNAANAAGLRAGQAHTQGVACASPAATSGAALQLQLMYAAALVCDDTSACPGHIHSGVAVTAVTWCRGMLANIVQLRTAIVHGSFDYFNCMIIAACCGLPVRYTAVWVPC